MIANDSDHSGVSIEVASPGSAIMVWTDDRNTDVSDLDIYTFSVIFKGIKVVCISDLNMYSAASGSL